MESQPAMKKDKLLIHTTLWVDLKILSTKASPKRLHTVWFHLYKILEMTKTVEIEDRLVVARGLQGGVGTEGRCVWL